VGREGAILAGNWQRGNCSSAGKAVAEKRLMDFSDIRQPKGQYGQEPVCPISRFIPWIMGLIDPVASSTEAGPTSANYGTHPRLNLRIIDAGDSGPLAKGNIKAQSGGQ